MKTIGIFFRFKMTNGRSVLFGNFAAKKPKLRRVEISQQILFTSRPFKDVDGLE